MKRNITSLLLITSMTSMIAPHRALADDVATVCGDYANETLAHNSQKQPYCAAAKTAAAAAAANDIVWKVYAAATAVCTTACVASLAGMGLGDPGKWACTGASVGASGLDAIKTQDYTAAMTNVAAAGVGYFMLNKGSSASTAAKSGTEASGAAADSSAGAATDSAGGATADSAGGAAANSSGAGAAQAAGKTTQSKDWGSCISAASTAYSTYTKKTAEDNALQTEKQNLASVTALSNTPASGTPVTFAGGGDSSAATAQPTSLSGTTGLGLGSGGGTQTPTAQCASASASPGNVQAALQCAASTNAALGQVVGNPNFADNFKTASGMPLSDFLKNAGNVSPQAAMAGAMGGALTPEGVGKVSAALAQLEPSPAADFNDGGYSTGGGSVAKGGGGDDMGAMIAGIMGKLNPKKGGTDSANNNGNELTFGLKTATRTPASAEDRQVSLFDRVTYRYSLFAPKLSVEPPRL